MQTCRQMLADRHAGRQADTDSCTERYRQTCRHTDMQAHIADRHYKTKQADRQADTYRQEGIRRQTGRQAGRHKQTGRH